MSLSSGSQLGPYRIVSQLGQGGMGVVYQAHDPRLDRHVAIKLLPPDLTRDETAKQRFLQEAKAASALDHPNICTIHEINETADGQLYLVMAHYEGETLKERISRGPLDLNDAVDIATQVGEGLAEAHQAGIVHRDIKPANLLVTKSGVVKILDFGLAKLAGAEGVTQTGTTVGTVAYMSPEQAKGQEVDHRTDIWSLGVVLYEMLAGEPPFQGANLLSISNAITGSTPPPLTASSSSAQPVVTKALSKEQRERYQAAADLLRDLRKVSSSAAVASPKEPDIPSIAVLPFRNMSADPEQEYFCEGLAEELIDALARLEGLQVAARTSAFQFGGKGHDLAEVGEKLKVKTILEGSVRKAGARLRVNTQLINAKDGYHIWTERYDRTMDDVFALQDEITTSVVEKLKVRLLGEEAVDRPTHNVEAYNLFLKGRYCHKQATASSLAEALECFTRAVMLDPDYGQAHAGIAQAQTSRAILSFARPHEVMPAAKESALRALALDDNLADAHFALAFVLDVYEWDWLGAEREYWRALEVDPGDTFTRGHYAEFLSRIGRAEDAVAEARRTVALDPLLPLSRHFLVTVLTGSRRFEEAITEARSAIALEPDFYILHVDLGQALMGRGSPDEAVEECRTAVSLAPGDLNSLSTLGSALAKAGREQEARAVLRGLEERRGEEFVGPCFLAGVYLALGDSERAIALAESALEERDGIATYLHVWFGNDPLRSDARFQALLRKMNFPA